jgi:hypothetical protein
MQTRFKKDELILMISSLLEKHRDALSIDEVQSFEKTIDVLKKLEGSAPKEFGKVLEPIALNLLKFFTKPEIMGQLMEWFND